MPLIIPKDLPAYEELQQENVFVMHQERAMSQHIRPLRILILNLMPTKIVTETQLARLLAKCVRQTPAGPGMGLPVKMQFALDQEGRARVLWAALRAGLDKLRGIHGTFYRLLGPEVRGLDGFYGEDIPAYADLGIRIPTEPDLLCDQVYEKTGVQSYIVDANGLGVELMGKSSGITAPETWLTEVIRDNPAGQEEQMTPFILVRRLRDVG